MIFSLTKNDRKAKIIIYVFSVVVFLAVTVLEKITLDVDLGFNPHVFAAGNAIINSMVALLLVAGIITAQRGLYTTHKNIMLSAIFLSVFFLVSYILHHLFAGSTFYGDLDKNGIVSEIEKAEAGSMRYIYFFLLGTHILLAGISLPFILFTAYRALINENAAHRKIAKITWPMWFYVAVSGPLVYLMISRYY